VLNLNRCLCLDWRLEISLGSGFRTCLNHAALLRYATNTSPHTIELVSQYSDHDALSSPEISSRPYPRVLLYPCSVSMPWVKLVKAPRLVAGPQIASGDVGQRISAHVSGLYLNSSISLGKDAPPIIMYLHRQLIDSLLFLLKNG
jgi:hypothetical protein